MPRTTARYRTRVAVGLSAGVLMGAVAACGGAAPHDGSAERQQTSGRPAATKAEVTLADFRLKLSRTTFTAGQRYDFVARNHGQHMHALEIEGPGGEHHTRTLKPGASASLGVTLRPGTYEVYCPVDGHKGLGMQMKITAVGAGGGY
ncbi:cupredoxin domain-containing protein [Streptomyces chattanoogensis]|uniref:cupredoxin domain-containing protein n=1 Tax=Streptomyces chattanoogensis TaxID=66876 RepID=UPI00368AFA8A